MQRDTFCDMNLWIMYNSQVLITIIYFCLCFACFRLEDETKKRDMLTRRAPSGTAVESANRKSIYWNGTWREPNSTTENVSVSRRGHRCPPKGHRSLHCRILMRSETKPVLHPNTISILPLLHLLQQRLCKLNPLHRLWPWLGSGSRTTRIL